MLLSARFLQDVQNVNSFRYVIQPSLMEGDAATIYFQLIDASLDRAMEGFSPAGRRYMPVTAATLSCVLVNIDQTIQITRAATQPYTQDKSIWTLPILATDGIKGTVTLQLALTEPAVPSGTTITRALINNAINIWPRT